MENILEINNLNISFGEKKVVNNISFALQKGNILGIVGESGSGKSMTSLAIMGLLPEDALYSGNILYNGVKLNNIKAGERRDINGKKISMIFQEPMTSLNPLMKVGKQVEEMLTLHGKIDKKQRKQAVIDMFRSVELDEPEKIYNCYPHNLSGGMRQRVMIAMAMILKPEILIADEPTTALDNDVEKEIIKLILKLKKDMNISVIFVSHDLSIIHEISDYILVMKDGQIVERGITKDIFRNPSQEYTKMLLNSVTRKQKENIENYNDNILEIKNLSLYYNIKRKKKSPDINLQNGRKYILEKLNFTMKRGEILGIQGKSGCGKTTLANAILGFHKGYDGEIILNAKGCQMVFQDPYGSLNPVRKIGWILGETYTLSEKNNNTKPLKEDIEKKISDVLKDVGLSEDFANRYPRELSGGQRQRVSIAVALIGGSRFIIADEPVSALDVTIQKQILELLLKLQKEYGLSILFISHDRNVMKAMCDRIIEL